MRLIIKVVTIPFSIDNFITLG
ncbi:MAG: hypothetical protein BAJALOKI3v1_1130011, partial [Promethearchaeota archaeon]